MPVEGVHIVIHFQQRSKYCQLYYIAYHNKKVKETASTVTIASEMTITGTSMAARLTVLAPDGAVVTTSVKSVTKHSQHYVTCTM